MAKKKGWQPCFLKTLMWFVMVSSRAKGRPPSAGSSGSLVGEVVSMLAIKSSASIPSLRSLSSANESVWPNWADAAHSLNPDIIVARRCPRMIEYCSREIID